MAGSAGTGPVVHCVRLRLLTGTRGAAMSIVGPVLLNYAKSPEHAQNQVFGVLLVVTSLMNTYMKCDPN